MQKDIELLFPQVMRNIGQNEDMNAKVGIILVNYNGKKYIKDCIDSLLAQTYKNIEILFWDNHSEDNSVKIIKQMYPQIHLQESRYNYGFAKANNLAVEKMLETEVDYLLLLNVDTVADPHLIEHLLQRADDNTVTTPQIYRGERGRDIWYAGGRLLINKGDSRHCKAKKFINAKRVTFISGCCMMIHRDIIRKHGLFDTNYYLYYEDTDLCMRWYLGGVHMYYIPYACLWHKIGGSIGGMRNALKEYYIVRNRLYFVNKYKAYLKTNTIKVLCSIILEEVKTVPDYGFRMIKPACLGFVDYFMKKMGRSRHNL